MAPTKQNLLKVYDSHIDEVFTYFYDKTEDRAKAKVLSQNVFMKMWDHVKAGKAPQNIPAFLNKLATAATI